MQAPPSRDWPPVATGKLPKTVLGERFRKLPGGSVIVDERDPAGRRSYRNTALMTGIPGVIALAYAIMAYRHAPIVPDLYDLVYHGDRPSRPEGTALFLFVFPAFLLFGAMTQIVISLRGRITRRNRLWIASEGGRYAITMLWAAAFFFSSIHRSSLVLHHAW